MPDAPDDPELTRLLGILEDAAVAHATGHDRWLANYQLARTCVLAHIARAYVRRDRLRDDGPWEAGDGSPYAAALDAE